jgi:hypothetical protein
MVVVGWAFDPGQPQRSLQGGGDLYNGERHVDARGGVAVGILQFGFGQGRAGTGAPMHRFEAAIDVAGQGHAPKHPDLGRFISFVESEVGLFPVAPDAPALKALLLQGHLLQCVGVGAAAQLEGGEGLAFFLAEGLQHLQLNGQAMAVPSRHEAGPEALEQGVLVDDVFEDLVQGVAHMQGAVGIGRSVMEREERAGVLPAQAFIEPELLPEGLQLWFTLAGVGPHRERRVQQVQGVLVGRAGGSRWGGHNASGGRWGLSRPACLALARGLFRGCLQ